MSTDLESPLSVCCKAPTFLGGMPDFATDDYICTTYPVCSKCKKPCDILHGGSVQMKPLALMSDTEQQEIHDRVCERMPEAMRKTVHQKPISGLQFPSKSMSTEPTAQEMERLLESARSRLHYGGYTNKAIGLEKVREYIRILENEHRAMREALEKIANSNYRSEERKQIAKQVLSSLTLKP